MLCQFILIDAIPTNAKIKQYWCELKLPKYNQVKIIIKTIENN